MSKKNRKKPKQVIPTKEINQDIADTPMEARWFDAGDRMGAKPKMKEDWER